MKSEGMLLNVVCLVMALLFLGLAALNFFSAGNFISTDSLFFTTVAGMMALLFLLVPALTLRANKKAAQLGREGAPVKAAAPLPGRTVQPAALRAGGANIPVMKDAKGRPVPPDVRKMMEQMREPETKAT